MNVIIKNLKPYARQVQYFAKNQYVILQPHSQLIIEDINRDNQSEINYYESLRVSGFSVCFHEDDKCIHEEIGIQKDKELDLSKFSDEEIRKIIQNLQISTRVRVRWKLENLILENIGDKDINNLLQED